MVCLFHTYCQYFAPKELHRDTSDVGVIVRDRRVMQSVVEKVIMMGD